VSLSIGIAGLPNVGKSTLFNALTRAGALASSYAFATIEPNVGVVGVPDPRLAELAKLYDSARIVPASVRFAKDAERARVAQTAEAAEKLLFTGVTLWAGAAAAGIDLATLRELQLLTAKPFLYVFNCDVGELGDTDLRQRLSALVAPAEAVFLDAKTEADLTELPEDEAAELLAEAGLGEPGLTQLAQAGFRALGLQTFLTAGPKEARAWTIKAGATAPQAAGVIHSDFQRGFIKAEVVSYDDLIAAGSVAAARAAGKARIEGKDYVMRDGDVVEFRFQTTSGGKAVH